MDHVSGFINICVGIRSFLWVTEHARSRSLLMEGTQVNGVAVLEIWRVPEHEKSRT